MTKGQIEAKISEVVTKFEMNFMGRGPKQLKTRMIEDLIIIRQKGFLNPAEQKVVTNDNGIELIKQVRAVLFENSVEDFKRLINGVIDTDIVSVFSDVSTRTGEKVIVVTFNENIEEKFNM